MGLQGTWYNELGSMLTIEDVSGGIVTGQYETGVSSGGCAEGSYAVQGTTDTDSGGQSVGLTVTWLNAQSRCNSTTTWAGQYQEIGGAEVLTAMWLLVIDTAPDADWSSTLVGQDVFTRTPPPEEAVAQVAAGKRHAHP
jgi:Avidin family